MPSELEMAIEKKLASLPTEVYDFVFDPEEEDTSRIFAAAGLVLEQKRLIRDDIKKLYTGDLPVASFLGAMTAKLPELGEEKLKIFVIDFIGYRLLPLDDFLGGQPTSVLRELGGDPANYPAKRIIIRGVRPEELVTEILHEHPVDVPAFLEHRLREILESLVRGVRKGPETQQRLTRAEKIGGVELEPAIASDIVAFTIAKTNSVKIYADSGLDKPAPAISVPLSQTAPVVDEPIAKSPVVPANPVRPAVLSASAMSKKGDGMTADDEREAQEIRENVLPNLVSDKAFDFNKEVQLAVDEVAAAFASEAGSDLERFKNIATSRLRGVRDTAETNDLLSRPKASGGMGFTAPVAGQAAAVLTSRFKNLAERRELAVQKEKDAFVKNEMLRAVAKDEGRKRGEAEDLDRLYGSLTKKVPVRPAVPTPAVPAPVSSPLSAPVSVPQPPSAPKLSAVSSAIPSVSVSADPFLPVVVPEPANDLPTTVPKKVGTLPMITTSSPPVSNVPKPPALSAIKIIPGNVPSPSNSVPKPPRPALSSAPVAAQAVPASGAQIPPAPAGRMAIGFADVSKPQVPPPKPPESNPVVASTPVSFAPPPKPTPAVAPAPLPPMPSPSLAARPITPAKMQDVRPTPNVVGRLTGPVEELRNITLADFRRLSTDPVEACHRLKDKLDLLEEQAYAQRVEGVKAWQQSSVYKLYLDVIMASFSGGRTLTAIIGEKQSAGQESLTEREVRAIMDLNKTFKA